MATSSHSPSGHTPGPHTPDPTLQAIAQATAATADAVTRLLAVQRFGPTAGAGYGAGGFAGCAGGTGATPAPGPGMAGMTGPRSTYERSEAASARAFAARQQGIAETSDTLSRLGMTGPASSMNRTAHFAGGLQSAGMGGAARLAGGAAFPLAAAGMIATGAEKAAGYYYDKYSTTDQKLRSFVREIPGGERAQRFFDSMSGRAAGMEESEYAHERRMAGVSANLEKAQFHLGYQPTQAGYEGLAAAFQKQKAITPTVFDRSTALGERAHREEQILLPLKQAEARAERELARATAERLGTAKQMNSLNYQAVALKQRDAEISAKLAKAEGANPWAKPSTAFKHVFSEDSAASGVARQNLLKERDEVQSELQGIIRLQQQGSQNVVGATRRELEARQQVELARNRVRFTGQAEILDRRADAAESTIQRLSGMNLFQRSMAVQFAKHIADRGTAEGLPDEMRSLGQLAGGDVVRKIIEQDVLRSTPYQALSGDKRFEAVTGDPNALRRQADELRKQGGEADFNVESAMAKKFAAAGDKLGDQISALLDRFAEQVIRRIEGKILLGRGSR